MCCVNRYTNSSSPGIEGILSQQIRACLHTTVFFGRAAAFGVNDRRVCAQCSNNPSVRPCTCTCILSVQKCVYIFLDLHTLALHTTVLYYTHSLACYKQGILVGTVHWERVHPKHNTQTSNLSHSRPVPLGSRSRRNGERAGGRVEAALTTARFEVNELPREQAFTGRGAQTATRSL